MDILFENRKRRAGVSIAIALSFAAISAAAFFAVPRLSETALAQDPVLNENTVETAASSAAAGTAPEEEGDMPDAREDSGLPSDPYTTAMEFGFRDLTVYRAPGDEFTSLIKRALENAELRLLRDGCFVLSLPPTTSYMEWTKEGDFIVDMSNAPPEITNDGERNFDAREEYILEAFEIRGKVEGLQDKAPMELSGSLKGEILSANIRVLVKNHMLNGNPGGRYFEEWTNGEYFAGAGSIDRGSSSVSLCYRTEAGEAVSDGSLPFFRGLELNLSCPLKYDSTYLCEGRFLDDGTYTMEEPGFEEVHEERMFDVSIGFRSTKPVEK